MSAPSAWQLETAMACFQALERGADPETDMQALDLAADDAAQ